MTKKVIVFTIIFIIVLININVVHSYYLGNTKLDESNLTYKIDNKAILKPVIFEGTNYNFNNNLYSLSPEQIKTNNYNNSFNMKNPTSINTSFYSSLPDINSDDYNALIWLADNIYVSTNSSTEDSQLMKEELLTAAGISNSKTSLKNEDIEAIQQLSFWYFSKNNKNYKYEEISKLESFLYEKSQNIDEYRMADAKKLYSFLIKTAKSESSKYGKGEFRLTKQPINFEQSIANSSVIKDRYIIGPFKLVQNIKSVNNVNIKILDENSKEITDYIFIDSTGLDITENIINKEFFVSIPKKENITQKIKIDVKIKYFESIVNVLIQGTTFKVNPSVLKINKKLIEYQEIKEVDVIKPTFNLDIKKVDLKDNSIAVPKTQMQITLPNNAGYVLETTNDKGYINLKQIEYPGEGTFEYIIQEKMAAENYELIKTPIKFNLTFDSKGKILNCRFNSNNLYGSVKTENDITEVTIKGSLSYSLQILKRDQNTKNPLNNSKLEIKGVSTQDGIIYNESKITENGLININNLTGFGEITFKIAEKQATEGYLLDKITKKIVIKRDEKTGTISKVSSEPSNLELNVYENRIEIVLDSTEIPDYSLRIIQKDGINDTNLNGIKYNIKVKTEAGVEIYSQDQETKDGGKINISNLRGTGTINVDIKEISVIDGYVKNSETQTIKLKRDSNTGIFTKVSSYPENLKTSIASTMIVIEEESIPKDKFKLEIVKKDLQNNIFLDGANYKIKIQDKENTLLETEGKTISNLTGKGDLTIILNEILTPNGYVKDYAEKTIKINRNETTGEIKFVSKLPDDFKVIVLGGKISVIIDAKPISTYNFELVEKDAESGTGIDLSKFQITATSSNGIVKNEILETANSGKINLSNLTGDGEIIFKINELQVQGQYEIDANIYSFTVNRNATTNETILLNKSSNNTEISIQNGNIYFGLLKTKIGEEIVETNVNNNVENQGFDLALKKFISGVNSDIVLDRLPQIKLDGGKILYTQNKESYLVKKDDNIIYTIRIYNEGTIDGYARQIKETIPEGLELVVGNEINEKYRWVLEQTGKIATTDYLSRDKNVENLIAARNLDNGINGINYKDVQIVLKVTEPNTSERVLINVSQISSQTDRDGIIIDDIDSTPNNTVLEDDTDTESVRLQNFDMALRMFITEINNQKITDRYPEIVLDENKNVRYIHKKDAITVRKDDVIIFTIRVYNEGKISGYAETIKNISVKGLKFLPDNAINKQYKWVSSGKSITTNYLSREENNDANIIEKFDKQTMLEPNYKEIKVAFKVTEPNTTERIVKNTSEISKKVDEQGREVTDIDSVQDNQNVDEDDLDVENIRIEYFDFRLDMWVNKIVMIENGISRITDTGYTEKTQKGIPYEIKLTKKDISKTELKFVYILKIKNEGEIAGYAKEIAASVPNGLEFKTEDNPKWKIKSQNIIITSILDDQILNPGDTKEIELVLTWVNNVDNTGIKTNVAEIISITDNNKNFIEDIDSITNNANIDEDDIAGAPILIKIQTSNLLLYIILIIASIGILYGGLKLIKKHVLK